MLRLSVLALLLSFSPSLWAASLQPTPAASVRQHYLKTSGRIAKVDEQRKQIYIRQDTRMLVFSADSRLCAKFRQKTNRKVTAYYVKTAQGELVLKNIRM